MQLLQHHSTAKRVTAAFIINSNQLCNATVNDLSANVISSALPQVLKDSLRQIKAKALINPSLLLSFYIVNCLATLLLRFSIRTLE